MTSLAKLLAVAIASPILAAAPAPQATARAAELHVFAVRAGKTILEQIGPEFERRTGNRIVMTFSAGPALAARINAGEPFDLIITGAPAVDALVKSQKLAPDTQVALFRTAMGVPVRPGTPKPDISSPEKLKQALLHAKSVIYLKNVNRVEQLIARLGITDALAAKTVAATTDNVSEEIVEGRAELGITVLTQILTTQGAELAGPLPRELQYDIVFAGGVSLASANKGAARALLQFFRDPSTIAAIKAQGMEPARE